MDAITTMLAAIVEEPGDATAWLALADGLCETGHDLRAELVRTQLAMRQPVVENEKTLERRLRELWSVGVTPCLPARRGPHGMEFVLIPPGSFWMGAEQEEPWSENEERPRRRVTLSRGFWLGTAPVMQHQWEAIMATTPANYYRGNLRLPVESVSHHDSLAYCDRLREAHGLGARLPTEAEWEYACRAGTTTMYCSGDGVEALRRVGWCSYDGDWDAAEETCPVRSFAPNAWGLHDMHGNVWEWCADWFREDYYTEAPAIDPIGPAEGQLRSIRGGSYRGGPWFCRSAARRGLPPDRQNINVGFRVAVSLTPRR